MSISFSKHMFFLWYLFARTASIISTYDNEYIVETKIKKLKLKKSNSIKLKFLLIKYIPAFFFILLSVSINELKNLDLVVLLAPLYMILNIMFFKYNRILIPISIATAVLIFIFYNILIFPIFIKYLIISYVLIELYLDLFLKEQFYVYEIDTIEKPVAFAVISKRSIN